MKICVLIPSFDEEKTIAGLVREVRAKGYDVLVIDDGSRDRTAAYAQDAGAHVLVNEKNMGKGAALRRGFELLTKKDYDGVIVMDGDGQHLPGDLDRFAELYRKSRPGVIVGNRMAEAKGMPWVRWLTNRFMSFLLSRKCGQRVPDSQCGFRLIDTRVLRLLDLKTENFEIESEILLEAAQKGFAITSVPITTVYAGEASAIHPIKDTIRFFKFMARKT